VNAPVTLLACGLAACLTMAVTTTPMTPDAASPAGVGVDRIPQPDERAALLAYLRTL
jgi:hypothetical protein